MKIKSLYLKNYGKFEETRIDLSDSFNVIYGNNEAGKSTVMSFIRAMLYGFGDGRKGDRKKYIPWNGKKTCGEMDLVTDSGEIIRIAREMGRTQSQDMLTVINLSNGEEYIYDVKNITGLGEEAFVKSFYIRQLGALIGGESDEIAQKLINLAHSGSQDVNYHAALCEIEGNMKRYKPFRGSGGLIKELENKITALNTELAEAKKYRLDMMELENRREELETLISKGGQKLEEIKKLTAEREIYDRFTELEEACGKADMLRRELDTAAAEADGIKKQSEAMKAYENTPDAVMFADFCDTKGLEAALPKGGGKVLPVIFAVLAALGALASVRSLWALVPAAVFAAICAVFAVLNVRARKRRSEIEAQIEKANATNAQIKAELDRFNAADLREYSEKKAAYTALKARLAEIEKRCMELAERIAKQDAENDAIRAQLGGAEKPDSQYTVQQLAEAEANTKAAIQQYVIEKSRIDGVLSADSAVRPPDIILTERAEASAQLDDALTKHNAYAAAHKALQDAYSRISSDFTPAVNKKASEILLGITGKYGDIISDRSFSVAINHEGTKQIGYFSNGTVDQVYMALRLAVTDILFGTDKPLFIDDPFLTYDTIREGNLMRYLKERSDGGQQIVIFACRNIENAEDLNTIFLT